MFSFLFLYLVISSKLCCTLIIAGFSPSVCSGVVAKIVKAEAPPYYGHKADSHIPAMLETTAAVHPGGSGGAVINSEGHMIGLITRYS